MVCVDTSILIDFFRGANLTLVRHVSELLESGEAALPKPAAIEVLIGTPRKHIDFVQESLHAFHLLVPDKMAWARIDRWLPKCSEAHQTFGVADLLVAALATEDDLPIWSLDHDFERMESLGFCRVYRPGRTTAS